jgi:hypothetical protein
MTIPQKKIKLLLYMSQYMFSAPVRLMACDTLTFLNNIGSEGMVDGSVLDPDPQKSETFCLIRPFLNFFFLILHYFAI